MHDDSRRPIEPPESGAEVVALVAGWSALLGMGLILIGLLAILLPHATAVAIEILVGSILVLGGIVQAVHALQARKWTGAAFGLVWSALYLVAGLVLLTSPLQELVAFTLVLATLFVIEGVTRVVFAMRLPTGYKRGWFLLDGVVGVLLGSLIWANWPSDASWIIGLFVGFRLVFAGWTMVMVALASRSLS
jgi:uncharacterized membrane protein HdeD (DUF308 family)